MNWIVSIVLENWFVLSLFLISLLISSLSFNQRRTLELGKDCDNQRRFSSCGAARRRSNSLSSLNRSMLNAAASRILTNFSKSSLDKATSPSASRRTSSSSSPNKKSSPTATAVVATAFFDDAPLATHVRDSIPDILTCTTSILSRNLLNKKEGVSAVKESSDVSQSQQTVDEQDGDAKGTNLKHENTVVHVDVSALNSSANVNQQNAVISTPPSAFNSGQATPTTPGPSSGRKFEIVRLTEQLVEALTLGNYDAYSKLCDTSMTSFQPESLNNLTEGPEFYKFYCDNAPTSSKNVKNVRTKMINPYVHLLGDESACIAYVILTQYIDGNGSAASCQCQETRLWQKRDGKWLCLHSHRSGASLSSILSKSISG